MWWLLSAMIFSLFKRLVSIGDADEFSRGISCGGALVRPSVPARSRATPFSITTAWPAKGWSAKRATYGARLRRSARTSKPSASFPNFGSSYDEGFVDLQVVGRWNSTTLRRPVGETSSSSHERPPSPDECRPSHIVVGTFWEGRLVDEPRSWLSLAAAGDLDYDGRVDDLRAPREGRPNNPCPCGGGKKYKKCCGQWTTTPSPGSVVPSQTRTRSRTVPRSDEHVTGSGPQTPAGQRGADRRAALPEGRPGRTVQRVERGRPRRTGRGEHDAIDDNGRQRSGDVLCDPGWLTENVPAWCAIRTAVRPSRRAIRRCSPRFAGSRPATGTTNEHAPSIACGSAAAAGAAAAGGAVADEDEGDVARCCHIAGDCAAEMAAPRSATPKRTGVA